MADWNTVSFFVRHGETTHNADDLFRGGKLDVPLNEQGSRDAAGLSAWFENKPIGAAFTSPLSRAQFTAQQILLPHNITPVVDPALKSLDVGSFSGQPKSDHAAEMADYQKNPDAQIAGGDSINQFRQRVRPAILKAIHAGVKSGTPSLVVTHSSVIHEVNNIIHGSHTHNLVKPGGVLAVQFNGKKFRTKPVVKPEAKDTNPYLS